MHSCSIRITRDSKKTRENSLELSSRAHFRQIWVTKWGAKWCTIQITKGSQLFLHAWTGKVACGSISCSLHWLSVHSSHQMFFLSHVTKSQYCCILYSLLSSSEAPSPLIRFGAAGLKCDMTCSINDFRRGSLRVEHDVWEHLAKLSLKFLPLIAKQVRPMQINQATKEI